MIGYALHQICSGADQSVSALTVAYIENCSELVPDAEAIRLCKVLLLCEASRLQRCKDPYCPGQRGLQCRAGQSGTCLRQSSTARRGADTSATTVCHAQHSNDAPHKCSRYNTMHRRPVSRGTPQLSIGCCRPRTSKQRLRVLLLLNEFQPESPLIRIVCA